MSPPMVFLQLTSRANCAELWCRPALLCPPFSAIDRRSASGTFPRSRPVRTMAAQLGYEAWVKGDPKTKSLGDCKQLDRVSTFVTLLPPLGLSLLVPCRPVLPPSLAHVGGKACQVHASLRRLCRETRMVRARQACCTGCSNSRIAQRVPSRLRHQHCTQATRANAGC